MLQSVCLSVGSMPLAKIWCTSGPWLLQNKNRKPHARSLSYGAVWPSEVAEMGGSMVFCLHRSNTLFISYNSCPNIKLDGRLMCMHSVSTCHQLDEVNGHIKAHDNNNNNTDNNYKRFVSAPATCQLSSL